MRDLAHRRAAYYANRDREQDPRQDYAEIYAREFHYTLNSDDELVDWARNQMDWVELDAQMVTPPPAVDYGEQWAGARVKVRR